MIILTRLSEKDKKKRKRESDMALLQQERKLQVFKRLTKSQTPEDRGKTMAYIRAHSSVKAEHEENVIEDVSEEDQDDSEDSAAENESNVVPVAVKVEVPRAAASVDVPRAATNVDVPYDAVEYTVNAAANGETELLNRVLIFTPVRHRTPMRMRIATPFNYFGDGESTDSEL